MGQAVYPHELGCLQDSSCILTNWARLCTDCTEVVSSRTVWAKCTDCLQDRSCILTNWARLCTDCLQDSSCILTNWASPSGCVQTVFKIAGVSSRTGPGCVHAVFKIAVVSSRTGPVPQAVYRLSLRQKLYPHELGQAVYMLSSR